MNDKLVELTTRLENMLAELGPVAVEATRFAIYTEGLALVAFNIISMVLLVSITSCLYRLAKKEDERNNRFGYSNFWTGVIIFGVISVVALLAVLHPYKWLALTYPEAALVYKWVL